MVQNVQYELLAKLDARSRHPPPKSSLNRLILRGLEFANSILQFLFRDAVGGCVIELGQQADVSDRGCLRPFALATEVKSRQHVLTQWGHEISPFVS